MRGILLFFLVALLCMGQAKAAQLPQELVDSAPESIAEAGDSEDWRGTAERLLQQAREKGQAYLREGLGGVVQILVILFLCGVVEAMLLSAGGKGAFPYVGLAACAAIVVAAAGNLGQLMGLGRETVLELDQFSKVLLPALAAAMASMGLVGAASVRQAATVLFCDVLISLICRLILPAIYLYIGALTAGSMLGDSRLEGLAKAIKKGVTWLLGGLLTVFTLYLSVAGAVSGAVDGAAVRVTKKAIAGVVPVVGGIISGAAETVLSGAGLLKNSIGIFGVLGVLAVCLLPFLQLAVQYLLYKGAAFAASTVAPPRLVRLIDGLGGAFGLVMGAVGSCALLLLISLISSLLVVAV